MKVKLGPKSTEFVKDITEKLNARLPQDEQLNHEDVIAKILIAGYQPFMDSIRHLQLDKPFKLKMVKD